ncbi:tyrosine- kinase Mer [Paramuricea clavata]|uniref:Tyrosine- kinase Mer n=1 Tax=Paramuricea clavata TaxID=317549 RepID=A0A6S7HFN2_PARCT|nr:tyrosine- kinase Mer [Paramuricea clavata]
MDVGGHLAFYFGNSLHWVELTPYPGIDANYLYDFLLTGRRLEPPNYCPNEIADVMSKCWEEDPDDRPNFHRLKEMLYETLCCETMTQTSAENEQSSNTSTPVLI